MTEIQQILYDKFNNSYDTYSLLKDYSNLTSSIKLKCKKHDIEIEQTPATLLFEDCPCPKCKQEALDKEPPAKKRTRKLKWEIDEVEKEFQKKHGQNFGYGLISETYKELNSMLWIYCRKHDITFQQTARNHLITEFPCPICRRESYKKYR